eukprot:403357252
MEIKQREKSSNQLLSPIKNYTNQIVKNAAVGKNQKLNDKKCAQNNHQVVSQNNLAVNYLSAKKASMDNTTQQNTQISCFTSKNHIDLSLHQVNDKENYEMEQPISTSPSTKMQNVFKQATLLYSPSFQGSNGSNKSPTTKSQQPTQPGSTKAYQPFSNPGYSPRFSNFTTVGVENMENHYRLQKQSNHLLMDQSQQSAYEAYYDQNLTQVENNKQSLNTLQNLQEPTNQLQELKQINLINNSKIQNQQQQFLLTLLEKTQKLADESETRLQQREREHQERIEQLKLMHQEEVYKLKAEVKIIQGMKNLEAKDSFNSVNTQYSNVEGRNQVIDKIRNLLVGEMEQMNALAQQRETKLKNEVEVMQNQLESLKKQNTALQNQQCQQQVVSQQLFQDKEQIIQSLNMELTHLKDNFSKEVEKLKLQNHLIAREQQQTDKNFSISQKQQDIKTEAFESLLEDFKNLQQVLSQHDQTTSEQLRNIHSQKEVSDRYYIEKISMMENKSSAQEKLIQQLKDEVVSKSLNFKEREQNLQKVRDQDLQEFQETSDKINDVVIEEMQNTKSQQQNFLTKSSLISQQLDNFYLQVKAKIENQSHPNYVQMEQTLMTLQQENHLLRNQNDDLHQQLVNGQNDENQSLIRLKLQLQKNLNDLREKIQHFHSIESQKDTDYSTLEKKLIELDQVHTNKEQEDNELIQNLTEELQTAKFELRKQESFNQKHKDKFQLMKNHIKELTIDNDKLREFVKILQDSYMQQQQNENSSNNCNFENDLKGKIEKILEKTNEKTKKVFDKKIGKVQKNLSELKEKHDELLIKHCRLINRLKSVETDQLITWQSRQSAYVDQLKHQRIHIQQISNTHQTSQLYKDLQSHIAESLTLEQDLLQNYQQDSEIEYRRQIDILDQRVGQVEQEKQSLIAIVREYEKKYSEVNLERELQVQMLNELNDQLKNYLECIEQGSIQDVLLKFDQMTKYIQENCKTQLNLIVDQIIQERSKINENNENIKLDNQLEFNSLVEYLNTEIEQLKQEDALKQVQLQETQFLLQQLQNLNSQQKIEYFQMRELFDRDRLRIMSLHESNQVDGDLNREIQVILNDLEVSCLQKKPAEINNALRRLKSLVLQEREDTEIVKRYSSFIQNELKNYLYKEIESLKFQKQKLLLNFKCQDNSQVQQMLKELNTNEMQRVQNLESQIEILNQILSSNSREKFKELVENIKHYVKSKHTNSSMLLAASTGIQTLNQTMSMKSLNQTQTLQKDLCTTPGPLIFLSPSKSTKTLNLNNTMTHHNLLNSTAYLTTQNQSFLLNATSCSVNSGKQLKPSHASKQSVVTNQTASTLQQSDLRKFNHYQSQQNFSLTRKDLIKTPLSKKVRQLENSNKIQSTLTKSSHKKANYLTGFVQNVKKQSQI